MHRDEAQSACLAGSQRRECVTYAEYENDCGQGRCVQTQVKLATTEDQEGRASLPPEKSV